jgi:flagellar M-ring protein FliF
MNELLKTLSDQLKGSGGGSKVVAALVGLAVVAAIGVTAVVSNRPDFQPAFVDLSGSETTNVCKALAEAGIPFRTSHGREPMILIDEDDHTMAYRAAYAAGALDKPLQGIISAPVASGVFMSARERAQIVHRKACEEMEMMLERCEFVLEASVIRSLQDSSGIRALRGGPATASVTLKTIGGQLSRKQGDVVAKLVSRGLGIEEEHLIVSDQEGHCLFDGSAENEDRLATGYQELLTFQQDHDTRVAEDVNSFLAETLGPGKARVTVSSTWGFDRSLTLTNTAGKGEPVSESKIKTSTPVAESSVGGPAGFSSNMPDLGGASTADTAESSTPPPPATTEETTTQYAPSSTHEQRVSQAPILEHLSVALIVDSSIEAAQFESLQTLVKAAVHYDAVRLDTFEAKQVPFLILETADDPEGSGEGGGGGMSPTMEMLLRRGVEIVTALVFIVLLLKSLKGAKSSRSTGPRGSGSRDIGEVGGEEEIDPDLLARVQVEELLRADPDRVGEILSEWAREEQQTTGAAS